MADSYLHNIHKHNLVIIYLTPHASFPPHPQELIINLKLIQNNVTIPQAHHALAHLSAGFIVSVCWLFLSALMEALAFLVRFGSGLVRSLGSL